MKNNYLFIIILALVIANVYFLFTGSLSATSSEEQKSKAAEIRKNVKSGFDRYLSNILRWNYRINGVKVNNGFIARDSRRNPVTIDMLIENHPVMVADFRFATCQLCLNSEIGLLKRFSTRAGPGKVFILNYFHDVREQKAFEEQFNVKTLSVDEGMKVLETESNKQSCVFVIDTTGRARDYFLPIKDTREFHPKYYDLMLKKYFPEAVDPPGIENTVGGRKISEYRSHCLADLPDRL